MQQPKQLPRPAFSMAAPQMHIEPCGNATQAVSKALGCWLPELLARYRSIRGAGRTQ